MVSVIVRWCSLSLVGQTAWTKGLLLCCKIIPPNQSKEAAFPMIVAVGSSLKISSVERARRLPVHEEDFAVGQDVTAQQRVETFVNKQSAPLDERGASCGLL